MLKNLFQKCRESAAAVLPVFLIVLLLNGTPFVSLGKEALSVFVLSTAVLMLGIALFNLGADLAMTPMGEHVGAGLSRSRNLKLLLLVSFAMGLLITVAEPDLSVLASQVRDVLPPTVLIVTVGVGVGLFLLLSVFRILFRKSLSSLLLFFYQVLFMLAALLILNGRQDFLALSFDSGGVTTGPITVPFIMALGVGIAVTLGGKNTTENSFGLVALCSVGPILSVLALGLTSTGSAVYTVPDYSLESHLGSGFLPMVLSLMCEILTALGMIVLFFVLLQIFVLRLPKKKLLQIAVGLFYTFIGLLLFLTSAAVGYMPVGYAIGTMLAEQHPAVLIGFGFVIGFVVVLAEPAVHVLKGQVEEVTSGTVSGRSMTAALSVGVGLSIALSMLRIVLDFNVLYYLIPGYILSLGLSFFVPPLYTAIAFDSGGVASGPLTSSFILPLAVGACLVLGGESRILENAFGIVAMVAMTPLITIQMLGFRAVVAKAVRRKIAMRRILDADDDQIIDFL